ncbi:hypothetical protein Tco_0554608 [Tanacetum coccineum]
MLSLRERMELDLEARLMGETLVLNRSLDPFFEDYIELNDINVPLELKRDQGDDLMPTIEEGEVVEEFRARNDARMKTMDAYRDEGIGDVIFGEPFLREVGINAKRFDGMINIYNDNESVTYRMLNHNPGPGSSYSIRRIPRDGYSVLEFVGVETTLDIFQNIHILNLEYGLLSFSGYGVLSLFPLWSLIKLLGRDEYSIISLARIHISTAKAKE